jgi:hypothetical protein
LATITATVAKMSSDPSGWLPLILSTFGGGVVGSLLTTYTSQTHERRSARVQVRVCLGKVYAASRDPQLKELIEAVEELYQAGMIAGLPEELLQLHGKVKLLYRIHKGAPGDYQLGEAERVSPLVEFLHTRTNRLLNAATRHPWRTRLYSWYLIRRYERLFNALDLHTRYESFGRKEYKEALRALRQRRKPPRDKVKTDAKTES